MQQQFWINQNGVQQGPMTLDQLRELGVKSDAYVWCVGMPDWLPVSQVPEVAALLKEAPVAAAAIAQELPETPATPEIPEIPANPATPEMPEIPVQQPVQQFQEQPVQEPAQQPQEQPKMPPTNLGWAIGSMLLCCIPLGIVAIIYSNKVSTSYYNGDFAKAEHYSEVSAWWCIATIVLGIISQPFLMLFSM